MHSPPQKQSAVHLSAALVHMQRLLQPFLHQQCKSSLQALEASGRVDQHICQPSNSFLFQLQLLGQGRSCTAFIAWPQQ